MEPIVSVIIPHYNRALLLKTTIESVLRQTYQNFELIVVDDGSDEDNYSQLQSYKFNKKTVTIIRRSSLLKGPSVCRNEGLAISKGEYIIFLDSDDILGPECLERRVLEMESNSILDFAVFNIKTFRFEPEDSTEMFSKHTADAQGYLLMFLKLDIPWQVMAPIWKKKALLQLGGFNEEMQYAEDPELHARALLDDSLKFYIFKNSIPDSYYRIHQFSDHNTKSGSVKSITGRIQFVISVHKAILASTYAGKEVKKKWLNCLGQAYKNIILILLTDPTDKLINQCKEFGNYCRRHKIINTYQFQLSQIIVLIWKRNYKLGNILHLKGLLTRLYLTTA
jgi:glycosyltransferase involved in cell wall biosynthesis